MCESITLSRLLWGLILASLHMICEGVLLVAGVMWLEGELELYTVIVKAGVLAAWNSVDEILYKFFAAPTVQVLMQNLDTIRLPKGRKVWMMSRWIVACVTVILSFVLGLMPEM